MGSFNVYLLSKYAERTQQGASYATALLLTVALLAVFSFPTGFVHAATAGPNGAGAATNISGGGSGTIAWTNAAGASNSGVASAIITAGASTNYIQTTNYSLNVPSDAIIDGIQVAITHRASNGGSIDDNIVRLMKAGVIVGDDKADHTTWSAATSTASYGGTADLWGQTWTAADINHANFGVAFSADSDSGSTRTAYVDAITITVTYTVDSCNTDIVYTKTADFDDARVHINYESSDSQIDVSAQTGYKVTKVELDVSNDGHSGFFTYATGAVNNFNPNPGDTINSARVTVQKDCDNTPPTIAEVTAVTTPDNDSTPDYVFSSNEAGTVTYGGSCSSLTPSVSPSNNLITFDTPVTHTPLADGTYSDCTITVTDASSNISNTLNVTPFTIDTVAPAAPVVTAPLTGTYVNSAGVNSNGTAEANSSITITGGSSTANATTNGSGNWTVSPSAVFLNLNVANTLNYTATDAAGNTSSATVVIVNQDSVNPTVTLSSGASNPTNASPIPVTAQFNEDVTGVSESDFVVGNGTVTSGSLVSVDANTYTFTVTPTADGPVTVDLPSNSAQDAATNGNSASNQLNRTYDTTAPGVTITYPLDGQYTNNTLTLTGTFTVTGGTSQTCSIDGGAFGACTSGSTHDLSGLSDGLHSFSVKAVDDATNEATATVNFTVDTVDPVPTISTPITTPSTTSANPIPVTVTFTEDVTNFDGTDILLSNGATVTNFAGSGSNYSFGIVPAVDGEITIDINQNVADEANGSGNTNASASQVSVTYVSTIDTTTDITNAAALTTDSSEATGTYQVNWSVSPVVSSPDALTGTVTVSDGTASCSAAVAVGHCDMHSAVGTVTLTATYSGDSNFNPSTSAGVDHTLIDSSTSGGGGGGGGNGPISGSIPNGQVLGVSISTVEEPQGQVLGNSTSTTETSTTTPQTTAPACSALITKVPMKQGSASNDAAQVSALQGFLNGEVGSSINVNGTFGADTTAAVNAFQSKYASDILAPWGLTAPTGVVYVLTQWKVNMLHCPSLNLPMPKVK